MIFIYNKINLNHQRQLRIIEDAENIVMENRMKELEDSIKSISFKYKPKSSIKDIDLSKLSLNKTISKKSKKK